MEALERVKVLDIPVDIVDMPSAMEYVDFLIQRGSHGNYVLAVNPEKVYVLKKDTFLKNMFERAALLVPDGIGVVLAVRWLYRKKIGRVAGADLMENLCRASSEKGYRIFIYGAKEEVSSKAVEILLERYSGIQIAGRCNGYVKEEGMKELIAQINASMSDILFVALGSPAQERWMQKYLPEVNVKICQGIGGTLDTIAGNVKRAPVFFQNRGLEWLYRLIKEPKRLRRQSVLPVFIMEVLIEKIRHMKV